ncbi:hypothetical protein RND61_29675 [Streptomyces sp. TRM76323]|uniref:Uncharacterized protein n=1 Tax=Streptomyces tamarix TaxID=3078565 RepID=A0ABU3QTU3_9ACTN|nr:hypothetical protein [Streptomyces tamarix]MDT9686205.1 hypothetical protein [Streptomyces tamarix]
MAPLLTLRGPTARIGGPVPLDAVGLALEPLAADAHHVVAIDDGHVVVTGTPDEVLRAPRATLTRRPVSAMAPGGERAVTNLTAPTASGS